MPTTVAVKTFELLFPVFTSPVTGATLAEFEIEPVRPEGTLTVKTMSKDEPLANGVFLVHVTPLEPTVPQVKSVVLVKEAKVKPAGRLSVTVMGAAPAPVPP